MQKDFLDLIIDYYREKRILRILDYQEQSVVVPEHARARENRKRPLFAYEMRARFFLLIQFAGGLNLLVSPLYRLFPKTLDMVLLFIVLFASIELRDHFWQKHLKDKGAEFEKILIGIIIVLFVAAGIFFKHFDKDQAIHSKINEALVKPRTVSDITSGSNWKIKHDGSSYSRTNQQEALDYCSSLGTDWKIPNKAEFAMLSPPAPINRSMSLWMEGFSMAPQFRDVINAEPKVFVGVQKNDKYYVLCFRKDSL